MKKAIPFIFLLLLLYTHRSKAQEIIHLSAGVQEYFPSPDSLHGWRILEDAAEIQETAQMDKEKLDIAFEFVRSTTKNGGLLVVRHGWLVFEKYFGKGQRDATPNLASCGKSFTSIAIGILISERPDLFPEGLDQKIFTPDYLPSKAFPLADPRMADIKLGQLLSFSAGIRGNNPAYIKGEPVNIDPMGPDGWYALVDEFALGLEDGSDNNTRFSTKTLWSEPGGGYSYATASIHIASIMLRHITGMEMEDYLTTRLAEPLGWGTWGFGYKNRPLVKHTPGGGGVALRSTDMLRLGYLLLKEGRWGQDQLVPEAYIRHATNASPYNIHFPYSLQFNVNSGGELKEIPEDTYWKSGSGGHCLYIVPSLDLIVWKLGGRDGQYSKEDTGITAPEPIPDAVEAIDNKNENIGNDHILTLVKVIDSINR